VGSLLGFDACFKSKDILDEVHDLDKTPLEGSCDVFMHEESPSLGFDNIVLLNPLNHFHVSSICSLPSQSIRKSHHPFCFERIKSIR